MAKELTRKQRRERFVDNLLYKNYMNGVFFMTHPRRLNDITLTKAATAAQIHNTRMLNRQVWEWSLSIGILGVDGYTNRDFERDHSKIVSYLVGLGQEAFLSKRYAMHALTGTYRGNRFDNRTHKNYLITIGKFCLMREDDLFYQHLIDGVK